MTLTPELLAELQQVDSDWRQRQTSMGPCSWERPFSATAWAGQ